jgi:signal transduction histidine kinase
LELVFEPHDVVFRVSDRGIGIAPSDRDRLFKKFERGSNIGTAPGVGLGLAIVQECVDLHGGEVVVESEVGVGTTITVILPLTKP